MTDTGSFAWQTGTVPDSSMLRVRVRPTDLAGNEGTPATSAADFSATNLRLTGVAHYADTNASASINAGDELLLFFDKSITLNGPTAADFVLPVAGDTLGAGAAFGAGADANSLLITLGTNPVLTTRGAFDSGALVAGAASGFELADPIAANVIEAAVGGVDAAAIGPIDMRPQPVAESALAASLVTPRRAEAGDLDGDGALDLVVAVEDGDPSEVWIGDGDHGWALTSMFDTDDTQALAIGDVDGDGDQDVVTGSSAVSRVWTNDGSGMLTDSGQTLGGMDTRGVLLHDFDRDGDLDAFFGNAAQNTVWTNDGLGVFTNSGQNLGSSSTVAIDMADLDRDGDMDVFAANFGAASRIWLNAGGTFTAGGTITQVDAQDVALGDFDRDGYPDVFVAVSGQNVVYLNDGTGAMAPVGQLLGNNDNRGVALLDLDGDGDLDAVTAKNLDSGRYWINDGSGVFTEDSVDTAPVTAVDVVAGRFDADGDMDFIMINDMGAYLPHRGSSAGGQPLATFVEEASALGMWQSERGTAGDVDGDGVADLIVPDSATATQVLIGDGDGGFTLGTPFGGIDATGGDLFDADGDTDLDYLQRIGAPGLITDKLWINDGNGVFTDSALVLGVDTFAAGDVDGDGDADIMVITATDLETWDGDGVGGFAASGQTLAMVLGTNVIVADFDGDGDPDLLAASSTAIEALENDGMGAFTSGATGVYADTTSMALGDVDDDGDLDIIFASSAGGTDLRFVANNGAFALAAATTALGNQTAFEQIVLEDVNEDGSLDLLAVDVTGTAVLRAIGNGDGTFQAATSVAVANIASVTAIDTNRDGDTDLYASKGTGAAAQDAVLQYR